ncbi:hypothetical protein AWF89_13280 [Escherichia coli]|nr:hypothetical protein AWF89_13280 [Escherichia coli]
MRAAFWVGCAALLLSACSREPVQQATAAHVAPGLKASMSSSGEGKLSNGELTAKGLAMTRMMCANPQLNELDNTISEMLKEGAQVDLTANQLTLATAKQTLTYKLADLMN